MTNRTLDARIEYEYSLQQLDLLHSYDALVRFGDHALSALTNRRVSHKTIDRIAGAITDNRMRDEVTVYPHDYSATYGDTFGFGWYYIELEDRFADLLTKSNSDYIIDQFQPYIKRGSQNVKIENNSGLIELWFKVYGSNGLYTPEFLVIAEIINDLEQYPALDGEDLSQREYDSALENIASELTYVVADTVTIDDKLTKRIWDYLWDNDEEALDPVDSSGEPYPSRDSLESACRALSIPLDIDQYDEEELED